VGWYGLTNGIFVIGTDTDVGKTLISSSLAWKLSKEMNKVCVMKPFATGSRIYSKKYRSKDVSILANSIGLQEDDHKINPFYYKLPCSPYMAAGILKQKPPSLNHAFKEFTLLAKKYDYIIVEGIGGLLVPLSKKKTLIDFIKLVNLEVVIISLPKVGTLNHTLLTINECVRNDITIRGIIINKMPTKRNTIETQTPKYLKLLTDVPIIGIVPELKCLNYDEKTFDLVSSKIRIGWT
jgi:dethiobiotin synthetase